MRSIKQLTGDKLGASDGAIGEIKDFYFDDRHWAVRYVVADTGSWLMGRQVLLSPHAFGNIHESGKLLFVNLTRKQIEDGPSIELHKPVSRQFEEEYYRYYGWPNYWQGAGVWGTTGFPILGVPVQPPASQPHTHSEHAEPHLLSAVAVNGYHLKATDGIAGFVCDFMMDAKSWVIGQLVIKIGHRFSGKEVAIPTSKIDRISYEESTVFVKLTREAVEQSPQHHLAPVGMAA